MLEGGGEGHSSPDIALLMENHHSMHIYVKEKVCKYIYLDNHAQNKNETYVLHTLFIPKLIKNKGSETKNHNF